MEEFQEIIEKLAGVPADKREAFADALQKGAGDLYLLVFNRGHSTATGQKSNKITTLEAERDQLAAEVKKANDALEAVKKQGDNPDLDKLRTEYDTALTAAQDEIVSLKKRQEERDAEHASTIVELNKDFEVSRVFNHLLGQHRVEDLIAKSLVSGDAIKSRMITDEQGKVTGLYQEDGKTPLPLPSESTVAATLAERLAATVPERYKEDARQSSTRPGMPVHANGGRKPTFSRSQIKGMSSKEYGENAEQIRAAIAEGRVSAD